jgi:hypothetical protein
MTPIAEEGGLRLAEVEPVTIEAFRALGGRAHRHAIYRKVPELGKFTSAQRALPPPARNRGGFDDKLTFLISFSLSTLAKQGRLRRLGGGEWELVEEERCGRSE